jgi:hypothetical protein
MGAVAVSGGGGMMGRPVAFGRTEAQAIIARTVKRMYEEREAVIMELLRRGESREGIAAALGMANGIEVRLLILLGQERIRQEEER